MKIEPDAQRSGDCVMVLHFADAANTDMVRDLMELGAFVGRTTHYIGGETPHFHSHAFAVSLGNPSIPSNIDNLVDALDFLKLMGVGQAVLINVVQEARKQGFSIIPREFFKAIQPNAALLLPADPLRRQELVLRVEAEMDLLTSLILDTRIGLNRQRNELTDAGRGPGNTCYMPALLVHSQHLSQIRQRFYAGAGAENVDLLDALWLFQEVKKLTQKPLPSEYVEKLFKEANQPAKAYPETSKQMQRCYGIYEESGRRLEAAGKAEVTLHDAFWRGLELMQYPGLAVPDMPLSTGRG